MSRDYQSFLKRSKTPLSGRKIFPGRGIQTSVQLSAAVEAMRDNGVEIGYLFTEERLQKIAEFEADLLTKPYESKILDIVPHLYSPFSKLRFINSANLGGNLLKWDYLPGYGIASADDTYPALLTTGFVPGLVFQYNNFHIASVVDIAGEDEWFPVSAMARAGQAGDHYGSITAPHISYGHYPWTGSGVAGGIVGGQIAYAEFADTTDYLPPTGYPPQLNNSINRVKLVSITSSIRQNYLFHYEQQHGRVGTSRTTYDSYSFPTDREAVIGGYLYGDRMQEFISKSMALKYTSFGYGLTEQESTDYMELLNLHFNA